MVRTMVFLLIAMVVFMGGASPLLGGFFTPLSLKEGMVEIPDGVVLPVDFDRLELRVTELVDLGEGLMLLVNGFGYSGYAFISEDGKEFLPYVEILRWSVLTGEINLCSLMFINRDGIVEFYTGSESPYDLPSGRLKRIEVPELRKKVYKVYPRKELPKEKMILLEKKRI